MDDVNGFRQNDEFRIEHQICYLYQTILFLTRRMCYVFASGWYINNGTWWGHVTACTHIKPQNYDLFKIPIPL